jgi:hypothetical protein
MRDIPAAVQAHRETRAGTVIHYLIWVTGRNRNTGAEESAGFWTGDTTQDITIGGSARTYVAAGAVLNIEPIRSGTGLDVRYHDISLSPYSAAVQAAVRQYDARLAPMEIHEAEYDPVTRTLLAEPHRVFLGEINEISEEQPAVGGEARLTVSAASAARRLTVVPSLFKSDSAMKQRSATDTFRAHVDIQGSYKLVWGERLKRAGDKSGFLSGTPFG